MGLTPRLANISVDGSADILQSDAPMGADFPEPQADPCSKVVKNSQESTVQMTIPNDFPVELLFSVLYRAIPPYFMMDTTFAPGGSSPWSQSLRLMKSIVLVSRSWYHVGVTFLYEHVCIRRVYQLEHLRRSLVQSSNLGPLVKSLNIQCYVPEEVTHQVDKVITELMDLCPSLSKFSFSSPCTLHPDAFRIPFRRHITHFRLDGPLDYDIFLDVLAELKHTLLSLHVTIWDNDFELSSNGKKLKQYQLHLSSLQSLSISNAVLRQKLGVLGILNKYWTMPALQRLTISMYSFFYGCRDQGNDVTDIAMQDSILSFLATHGSRLLQLHIGIHHFRFEKERFKSLLKNCPLLERIIIHPSTFSRIHWICDNNNNDGLFYHPNLRWIDFTHYFRDIRFYSSSSLCLSKRALPALRGVRRFCNLTGELMSWLEEFQPSQSPTNSDEFAIDIFQHQLTCEESEGGPLCVWQFEPDVDVDLADDPHRFLEVPFYGSFNLWNDYSSGSDYSPSSEEDTERSSLNTSDDEWTTEEDDESW